MFKIKNLILSALSLLMLFASFGNLAVASKADDAPSSWILCDLEFTKVIYKMGTTDYVPYLIRSKSAIAKTETKGSNIYNNMMSLAGYKFGDDNKTPSPNAFERFGFAGLKYTSYVGEWKYYEVEPCEDNDATTFGDYGEYYTGRKDPLSSYSEASSSRDPRTAQYSNGFMSAWGLSIKNSLANFCLAISKFILALLITLLGFAFTDITTLFGIGTDFQSTMFTSLYSNIFMPLVTLMIVLSALHILYYGIIKRQYRQSLISGLIQPLACFSAAIIIASNLSLIAMPNKIATFLQSTVISALVNNTTSTTSDVCSTSTGASLDLTSDTLLDDAGDRMKAILGCNMYAEYILKPWAQGQFGDDYNSLNADEIPNINYRWVKEPVVKMGSKEVKNWALFHQSVLSGYHKTVDEVESPYISGVHKDFYRIVDALSNYDEVSKKVSSGSSSGDASSSTGTAGGDWLKKGTEANKLADKVYKYLTDDLGLSGAAAVGVLANIEAESGWNIKAIEAAPTTSAGAGEGLFQFTGGNRTQYHAWLAKTGRKYDWKSQVDFLFEDEIWSRSAETFFRNNGPNYGVNTSFSNMEAWLSESDPKKATEGFMFGYERPNQSESLNHLRSRRLPNAEAASKIWDIKKKANKSKWKFSGGSSGSGSSSSGDSSSGLENCSDDSTSSGEFNGTAITGEAFKKALNETWTDSFAYSSWESNVGRVANAIEKVTNQKKGTFITYAGHQPNESLAIDFMTHKNYELGDTIAAFLIENMTELNIDYIIWGQKFYMNTDNIYGKAKVWSLMPDRGNVTQNHGDHVHVSFKSGNLNRNGKFNDTKNGGQSDGKARNGAGLSDFGGKVGGEGYSGGSSSDGSVGGCGSIFEQVDSEPLPEWSYWIGNKSGQRFTQAFLSLLLTFIGSFLPIVFALLTSIYSIGISLLTMISPIFLLFGCWAGKGTQLLKSYLGTLFSTILKKVIASFILILSLIIVTNMMSLVNEVGMIKALIFTGIVTYILFKNRHKIIDSASRVSLGQMNLSGFNSGVNALKKAASITAGTVTAGVSGSVAMKKAGGKSEEGFKTGANIFLKNQLFTTNTGRSIMQGMEVAKPKDTDANCIMCGRNITSGETVYYNDNNEPYCSDCAAYRGFEGLAETTYISSKDANEKPKFDNKKTYEAVITTDDGRVIKVEREISQPTYASLRKNVKMNRTEMEHKAAAEMIRDSLALYKANMTDEVSKGDRKFNKIAFKDVNLPDPIRERIIASDLQKLWINGQNEKFYKEISNAWEDWFKENAKKRGVSDDEIEEAMKIFSEEEVDNLVDLLPENDYGNDSTGYKMQLVSESQRASEAKEKLNIRVDNQLK